MNKQLTSILSYLSLLFWLIAYLIGDRENAKFYLNQSLTVNLLGAALGILVKTCHGSFFGVIFSIAELGVAILCVIGIYHAFKQDEQPNPIVGGIQLLK